MRFWFETSGLRGVGRPAGETLKSLLKSAISTRISTGNYRGAVASCHTFRGTLRFALKTEVCEPAAGSHRQRNMWESWLHGLPLVLVTASYTAQDAMQQLHAS